MATSDHQPQHQPTTDTDDDTLPSKLNLGCGADIRGRDWHNVDTRPGLHPDEIVDLDETPWPWPDDQFDHVLMDNVLEHLENVEAAMAELERITDPGGEIVIRCPHPNSRGFWVDPTHKSAIHPETFEHYHAPQWEIESVSVSRVRLGRLLPERYALLAADHVGHVVDEFEVVLEVTG